jgi:glucose-6-phosphate isomerase
MKNITIEFSKNYEADPVVAAKIPAIINTMSGLTGEWATDRFKDGTKTMLGWMSLAKWRESSGTLKAVMEFAQKVRSEKKSGRTTDIVFIGQGGSIECIKSTRWIRK